MRRFLFKTMLILLNLWALQYSGVLSAETEIGYVKRLQGSARIALNGVTTDLSRDARIFSHSVVTTGPDARLLLYFSDESKMILGANARVDLQDYELDPPRWKSLLPLQKITVLKGAFRFVTGLIAKKSPDGFAFSTPVATIGVRGTTFFGGPLPTSQPEEPQQYGFLILDGAITVDNAFGSSVLDEPKEGTYVPLDGSKAPTSAARWSDAQIKAALASVEFNIEKILQKSIPFYRRKN